LTDLVIVANAEVSDICHL